MVSLLYSYLPFAEYAFAPKKTDTSAEIATKYVGAISPIIPDALSNPRNEVTAIPTGYNSIPNKAKQVIFLIASRCES